MVLEHKSSLITTKLKNSALQHSALDPVGITCALGRIKIPNSIKSNKFRI